MSFRTLIDALSPAEAAELAALLAAVTAAPEFGTWCHDPEHPRCPLCGVQVKWSGNDEVRARCQDGAQVSRRFPGFGPECPWAGAPLVRTADGAGVRFDGEPPTAWAPEIVRAVAAAVPE